MAIKNLFKTALVFIILLSSISVFAQQQMPKRTPEQKAQRQTMWMQKNLGLTDDQNRKVYNIILRYAQDEENASANMQPGKQKKMEKKEIKQDAQSELQQVLSPDQYQRYAAHLQEMKEKRRQRGNGAPREQGQAY